MSGSRVDCMEGLGRPCMLAWEAQLDSIISAHLTLQQVPDATWMTRPIGRAETLPTSSMRMSAKSWVFSLWHDPVPRSPVAGRL